MARPKLGEDEKAFNRTVSFEPKQYERLSKFCQDEERQISWAVRKAVEEYLQKKGY